MKLPLKLKHLPEIFFIGLGVAWSLENFISNNYINYIALLSVWLLLLQLIYKNRLAGIIYGNILGMFSLYMLAALYSELREFETITTSFVLLMSIGGIILGTAIFMAGRMLYNYLTTDKSYEDNVLTISF
ncbi:MAG: hypothetical protein BM557_04420 [Flavobacterium sp. MedPE-SWcel]|uniref:hypothetical protein n=1 Tax=uncultured Flavobacterium sp. TaxID=165435 RepID=UPI000916D075|nr:hypothetical protein [uncultured Flavobacterium sp.]OIQ21012.1 MAG: hypothetical protein BM557_04420 [Flavobacterium sp. MedPE-SWcel]